jgi:hypothetical protein
MLRLVALAALLASAAPVAARPPPDPDPKLAPWFESLRQPRSGASCCSIADCRPADYRTRGDHYEVKLHDEWVEVPAEKILHRLDNPTGRGVVCWTPIVGIMCFVPGPET